MGGIYDISQKNDFGPKNSKKIKGKHDVRGDPPERGELFRTNYYILQKRFWAKK